MAGNAVVAVLYFGLLESGLRDRKMAALNKRCAVFFGLYASGCNYLTVGW